MLCLRVSRFVTNIKLEITQKMATSKKRQLEDTEDEAVKMPKKPTGAGHWSAGLLSAMEDPNLKVLEDDTVVVIKDKYPKAQVHYLVLPKEDISTMKKLTKEHLDLLLHMAKIAKKITKKHSDKIFKIGFHAQASMSRLHLHVISEDMDSPCMKTRKHWNSFTSEFFIPHTDVIKDVEENGHVTLKSETECKRLLSLALQCHKCKFTSSSMPQLKHHVSQTHFKSAEAAQDKPVKSTHTKFDDQD